MKKRSVVKASMLAVIVVASFIPVYAGSWNWQRPYKMPEKNVNTLIVIGNYRIPRLMADLIQSETKQPILLVPGDTDGKIFFMPAKDQTMPVEFDDLTDFIKYLKPGKIVVLGDKRYVPEKYLNAIDSSQTVISITNKSWKRVAETTSRILDLTYLKRRFRKYEAKIKSGDLYRPENPALGDDAFIKEVDNQPIVIIDESKSNDTIIVDDTAVEKDIPVIEPNITAEPQLIDETKVVPK
jgi:hypothetical protein